MIKPLHAIIFVLLFSIAKSKDILQLETTDLKSDNQVAAAILYNYSVFEVSNIDILNAYTQQTTKNELHLKLTINHKNIDAILTPNNLIHQEYKLLVGEINGEIKQLNSTTQTYHGYLKNQPNSSVALTIDSDFIYGMIQDEGNTYYIEPLFYFDKSQPKNKFIFYNKLEVAPHKEKYSCAVDEHNRIEPTLKQQNEANKTMVNQCYITQLAIASDTSMFNKYGSAVNVQNHNIGVMNNVALNYRHELLENIEFSIVTQYVSTSWATEPLSPNTTSTDVAVLLPNFRTWGQAGNFGVTYDVAQFWTNRDFTGSTIGYAYVGVICTSNRYQILQDYSPNADDLRCLTAHELGHNFNASHDAAGSAFIMAPSVNNSNIWSATSITDMNSHISTRTCFSNCSTAPTADFWIEPNAVCAGGSVKLKDKSANGYTRVWTTTGGSPSTSTIQQPTITYATGGIYYATIVSSNGVTTSTKTKPILVSAGVTTPVCSPSTTPVGNLGPQIVQIANISSSSGNGTTDGTRYFDRSCTHTSQLTPNTTYYLSLIIGDCSIPKYERVRMYIDYNNDGDFVDIGETIIASTSSWCGSISYDATTRPWMRFTTPASPPVYNTLLRMRIVTEDASLSAPNSCTAPAQGQVEDYGVFFLSPSILPIELVEFSANKINNSDVLLAWKTATEFNNDYFVVEHSIDGINFNPIATLKGAGTTTIEQYYSFTHQKIENAVHYYRLKQVDFDAKTTYSEIISIVKEDIINPIKIVQNTNNQFFINDNGMLLITDLLGKKIVEINQYKKNEPINIISKGIYLFKFTSTSYNQEIISKKIVY